MHVMTKNYVKLCRGGGKKDICSRLHCWKLFINVCWTQIKKYSNQTRNLKYFMNIQHRKLS